MVAFNFQERFALAVERGEKRHTIRTSRRARPGDDLQLYTGMRTKRCRLLRRARCTSVDEVSISARPRTFAIRLNGELISRGEAHELAVSVGFRSASEMVDFYGRLYGLPFRGWRTGWSV